MQRIINDPDHVVADMVKGFARAHADFISTTDNPRVLKYRHAPVEGKVGVVTGGGSGHKPADSGKGVACLYGNYAGDNMNVKMAAEEAEEDGIVVKSVVANADVASAPRDEREKRRGAAGGMRGRLTATYCRNAFDCAVRK